MTTETDNAQIVTDDRATCYSLIKKIGEGGQGEVWTTNHTNLVVKLSNSYTNRALLINHVQQVQNVMRLPLRDLKIALPLSLLQSENGGGYVMELMDGLESLSTQIENIQKNGQQLDMFLYRDTGSFGRRLQILKQLAETLAKLHGRGLAFGDLSPNNIFVSQSVEHHQVWLIDADNIHPIEQSDQHHFYTKGYAAPELIRNETGTNCFTDAWSFAVIALQLLTHTHPFNHGIAVEDEDPDVVEVKSERGEFAWVFDIHDDSNELAITGGFPVIQMLNHRLFNLFQRCFGDSRIAENLCQRPSMAEWYYELHRATRLLITCQAEDCRSHFIINKNLICPFCNESLAPEQYVRFSLWLYDTDHLAQDNPWSSCSEQFFLNLNEEQKIYYEPYSYFDMQSLIPWCTLKLTEEGLRITPEHGETVTIQNTEGSKTFDISKSSLLKTNQKGNKHLLLSHSSLQIKENQPFAFFWRFTW